MPEAGRRQHSGQPRDSGTVRSFGSAIRAFSEHLYRFIVVDGTYITHPFLPLNGSAKIANVHAMIGFMRDDGAAFISAPVSGHNPR